MESYPKYPRAGLDMITYTGAHLRTYGLVHMYLLQAALCTCATASINFLERAQLNFPWLLLQLRKCKIHQTQPKDKSQKI
jgi:hypothetical protein